MDTCRQASRAAGPKSADRSGRRLVACAARRLHLRSAVLRYSIEYEIQGSKPDRPAHEIAFHRRDPLLLGSSTSAAAICRTCFGVVVELIELSESTQ